MSRKEKDNRPLRFAILTVSNSRTYSDDTNGLLIQSLLTKAGHQVVDYAIVKDDGEAILKHIHEWVCSVDAIVTSGGTGLALRDVTLETLEPKFDKVIPEFNGMLTFLAYRYGGACLQKCSRRHSSVPRLLFARPNELDKSRNGTTYYSGSPLD